MSETWKHHAKPKKKAVGEGHICCDSMYRKCPDEANQQRQKVGWWMPRAEVEAGNWEIRVGGSRPKGTGFLLRVMKTLWTSPRCWLRTTVDALKPLNYIYTLKWANCWVYKLYFNKVVSSLQKSVSQSMEEKRTSNINTVFRTPVQFCNFELPETFKKIFLIGLYLTILPKISQFWHWNKSAFHNVCM